MRKAIIKADLREKFELFGKDVVALSLGMFQMPVGGGPAPTYAQREIWFNQDPAMKWLQEKRDEDDLHQTVTLILEISITALIILEIFMRVSRIGA